MARGYRFGVVGSISTVPDGRTVLPTDDVSIWLKCAKRRENYTTLAQVLADSTCLEALINNTNAMDYLVRCKDFIGKKAFIPTMTSNTTPSGVASSSTYYNQREAYKAFDGNLTYPNYWATSSGTGYVQYQFTSAVKPKVLKILQQVSGSSNWVMSNARVKVQGSNDGTNFTDIKQLDLLASEATTQKEYDLENNTSYSYLRLQFLDINMTVSGASYSIVGEAQFYTQEGVCDSANAMTYIGLNNYASNLLTADQDWLNGICDSTYFESILNAKNPVMTSNTAPSGECSASGVYSTNYAYKAFNGVASDHWYANGVTNVWLQYKFDTTMVPKMVTILPRFETSARVKNFTIKGSNDGTNFTDIFTGVCENSNTTQKFPMLNANSYQYDRIFVADNYTSQYTGIAEAVFYGRQDV